MTAVEPIATESHVRTEQLAGFALLARLGKQVLRPGGVELTTRLLDELAITTTDDVVEMAPGRGRTTRMILAHQPASYVAVDRDRAAEAAVAPLLHGPYRDFRLAPASRTGLPDASCDIALGEAFLSPWRNGARRSRTRFRWRGRPCHACRVLQAREIRTEAGGVTLLDGVSFTVAPGDKVGLVGRNGAGKTTLLKVLAGAEPPAGGTVVTKGGLGYLPQDPRLDGVPDDLTALRHVLSGRGLDEATDRLEKLRLRLEEDPSSRNVERYSRAEERFRLDGGYAAESEVRRLASGLGLDDGRLDLPIRALSGGERRRVELARILFAGSDVLLLDEPTNHLDTDAKEWMLAFLRSYRGALVVISHDLDLLDEAITRVLHLDRGGHDDTGTMVEYRGTYSQYRTSRQRDEVRLARQAELQAKEIARLQGVVDRFGAKATKAAMAHSIEKRITRLTAAKVDAPEHERLLSVRFPDPPRSPRTVLEVDALAQHYGTLDVFDDVTFDLGRGERLLVLGLNGAGKTSLLRILAGVAQPVAGGFGYGPGVIPGYYAQEHEGIVSGRTLLDHVREASPTLGDEVRRGLLAMFGLTGDKVFQDAATLSGGEKTKLALAQLVAGRHNLLLLDEPTNNLDPGSREAMATALGQWPGTLILVSHDAEFVARLVPDRVLQMPDGDFTNWNDGLVELVGLS